jgi:hypothetical protein
VGRVVLPAVHIFRDNASWDTWLQLERVLRRVQLSEAETELQPEVSQATEKICIASGELAFAIGEIESSNSKWSDLDRL